MLFRSRITQLKVVAWYNMAMNFIENKNKNFKKAVEVLGKVRHALKLFATPADVSGAHDAYGLLVSLTFQEDPLDKSGLARKYFNEARNIFKNELDVPILGIGAELCRNTGEYAEAEKLLFMAFEKDQGNSRALILYSLGVVYMKAKKFAQAKDIGQRLTLEFPEVLGGHSLLAYACYKLKDFDSAYQYYTKAMDLVGGDIAAKHSLSFLLILLYLSRPDLTVADKSSPKELFVRIDPAQFSVQDVLEGIEDDARSIRIDFVRILSELLAERITTLEEKTRDIAMLRKSPAKGPQKKENDARIFQLTGELRVDTRMFDFYFSSFLGIAKDLVSDFSFTVNPKLDPIVLRRQMVEFAAGIIEEKFEEELRGRERERQAQIRVQKLEEELEDLVKKASEDGTWDSWVAALDVVEELETAKPLSDVLKRFAEKVKAESDIQGFLEGIEINLTAKPAFYDLQSANESVGELLRLRSSDEAVVLAHKRVQFLTRISKEPSFAQTTIAIEEQCSKGLLTSRQKNAALAYFEKQAEIKRLLRAIKASDGNHLADRMALAALYEEMWMFPQAVEQLEKVCAINKNSWTALTRLANLYVERYPYLQGDKTKFPNKAFACAVKAVKVFPGLLQGDSLNWELRNCVKKAKETGCAFDEMPQRFELTWIPEEQTGASAIENISSALESARASSPENVSRASAPDGLKIAQLLGLKSEESINYLTNEELQAIQEIVHLVLCCEEYCCVCERRDVFDFLKRLIVLEENKSNPPILYISGWCQDRLSAFKLLRTIVVGHEHSIFAIYHILSTLYFVICDMIKKCNDGKSLDCAGEKAIEKVLSEEYLGKKDLWFNCQGRGTFLSESYDIGLFVLRNPNLLKRILEGLLDGHGIISRASHIIATGVLSLLDEDIYPITSAESLPARAPAVQESDLKLLPVFYKLFQAGLPESELKIAGRNIQHLSCAKGFCIKLIKRGEELTKVNGEPFLYQKARQKSTISYTGIIPEPCQPIGAKPRIFLFRISREYLEGLVNFDFTEWNNPLLIIRDDSGDEFYCGWAYQADIRYFEYCDDVSASESLFLFKNCAALIKEFGILHTELIPIFHSGCNYNLDWFPAGVICDTSFDFPNLRSSIGTIADWSLDHLGRMSAYCVRQQLFCLTIFIAQRLIFNGSSVENLSRILKESFNAYCQELLGYVPESLGRISYYYYADGLFQASQGGTREDTWPGNPNSALPVGAHRLLDLIGFVSMEVLQGLINNVTSPASAGWDQEGSSPESDPSSTPVGEKISSKGIETKEFENVSTLIDLIRGSLDLLSLNTLFLLLFSEDKTAWRKLIKQRGKDGELLKGKKLKNAIKRVSQMFVSAQKKSIILEGYIQGRHRGRDLLLIKPEIGSILLALRDQIAQQQGTTVADAGKTYGIIDRAGRKTQARIGDPVFHVTGSQKITISIILDIDPIGGCLKLNKENLSWDWVNGGCVFTSREDAERCISSSVFKDKSHCIIWSAMFLLLNSWLNSLFIYDPLMTSSILPAILTLGLIGPTAVSLSGLFQASTVNNAGLLDAGVWQWLAGFWQERGALSLSMSGSFSSGNSLDQTVSSSLIDRISGPNAVIRDFEINDDCMTLTAQHKGVTVKVRIAHKLCTVISLGARNHSKLNSIPAEANLLRIKDMVFDKEGFESQHPSFYVNKARETLQDDRWWHIDGIREIPIASIFRMHNTSIFKYFSILSRINDEESTWNKFIQEFPIDILDIGYGQYFILKGMHRFDLAYLLGLQDGEIPCKVYRVKESRMSENVMIGSLWQYIEMLQDELGPKDFRERFFKHSIGKLVSAVDCLKPVASYEYEKASNTVTMTFPFVELSNKKTSLKNQNSKMQYLFCLIAVLTDIDPEGLLPYVLEEGARSGIFPALISSSLKTAARASAPGSYKTPTFIRSLIGLRQKYFPDKPGQAAKQGLHEGVNAICDFIFVFFQEIKFKGSVDIFKPLFFQYDLSDLFQTLAATPADILTPRNKIVQKIIRAFLAIETKDFEKSWAALLETARDCVNQKNKDLGTFCFSTMLDLFYSLVQTKDINDFSIKISWVVEGLKNTKDVVALALGVNLIDVLRATLANEMAQGKKRPLADHQIFAIILEKDIALRADETIKKTLEQDPEFYNQVAYSDEKLAALYDQLGQVYLFIDRYAPEMVRKAEKVTNQALWLVPDHEPYLIHLIDIHLRQAGFSILEGDFVSAYARCSEAVRLDGFVKIGRASCRERV